MSPSAQEAFAFLFLIEKQQGWFDQIAAADDADQAQALQIADHGQAFEMVSGGEIVLV